MWAAMAAWKAADGAQRNRSGALKVTTRETPRQREIETGKAETEKQGEKMERKRARRLDFRKTSRETITNLP